MRAENQAVAQLIADARADMQERRLDAAEISLRRALELDDAAANIWLLLSQVLLDAGKLAECRFCLERIAVLHPDLPAVHDTLGTLLLRLGDTAAAEAAFRRAVSLAPAQSGTAMKLVTLLTQSGRHREVIELVDHLAMAQATESAPILQIQAAAAELACGDHNATLRRLRLLPADLPEVEILRLHGLRNAERFGEAEAICRVLLARPGASAEIWAAYALVLQGMGRLEDALAAFDTGIGLARDAEPLRVDKAVLLAEFGEIEPALAMLDTVLERQPDNVPAWYNKAHLKRFRRDDGDIERLRATLAKTALSQPDDAMWLHFAIGKALSDVGEIDDAFDHWRQGNALRRALVNYSAAETENFFRAIAAEFSGGDLPKSAASGYPSDIPVFIVGMPRSGTSLAEQILASHGEISGAGELTLLRRLTDQPHKRGGSAFPHCAARAYPSDGAALGRWYVRNLRQRVPAARRITDKMPTNFIYVGLIHAMLPRARIVYCRRDPLDTCFSCFTKLFSDGLEFSYDLPELGHYYRWHEALMAHWRVALPPETFLEVRYEDLVEDVEREARRMVAFCGLDWDPDCLAFHANKRQVRSASKSQVREPLYRSSLGAALPYRTHLGPLIEALDKPMPNLTLV